MNWERWARGAGIAFVVFTIASFIVGGEPPKVSDPAADVVSYYDGERGQVLISSFLFAVALGFWIWFAGALANSLRERGEGRVAATIIGAVSAFVSINLVSVATNGIAAHSVARAGEDGVTQALFNLTWGLDVVAAIPSAVFFLAASARAQAHPHDPGVAECGRHRCRRPLHPSNHDLGAGWVLVADRGVSVHPDPLALLWILITSVILVRSTPARSMEQPVATMT